MNYQFRPIDAWPGRPTEKPKFSPFKADYNKTLKLLEKELGLLQAKNIVIQAFVTDYDVRLDGMLRADCKPKKPGVILSFESKHGPLMYPCDTFPHWHDNLRAIALALEALRTVDRYGVTKRGEQYRGWTALMPALLPKDQAIETIANLSGVSKEAIKFNPSTRKQAILIAMKKAHPDTGGTHDAFVRVKEAAAVLEAHG